MTELQDVKRNVNFPEEEVKVLNHWDKIDAFKTSVEKNKDKPPFSFFDGPPFATGLPHYGHLLAGTIKDIVTRYAHQTGHHVERRFGWDCHGLPIEFAIEKELGLKTKDDILKFGIKNYNEACRGIVMKYSQEWEKTVKRIGRWIDFKNDYKTMNKSFMESVWWVFKQLADKDLVYRGFKVMPYSTACTTPLSNFEVQQNYKDVYDPAITISFPVVGEENTYFLAWTTTPWTLPSNLALCVNEEFTYVKIKDKADGKIYIFGESRLEFIYPGLKKKGKKKLKVLPYELIEKFKGKKLVGKKYVPLFDYFAKDFPNAFVVVSDDYVTDDSGTGIVHQAPAYGEDDFRICLKKGIVVKGGKIAMPIDDNARFVEPVTDFLGQYVKDADKNIIAHIKKNGRLIKQESIKHSYPFCWRSDTPLIYKAVPSWFVKVEEIKEQLLESNKNTYWVPNFVKEKRFHNWLEGARDWAISRTRYWGCPIPVWTNEDFTEVKYIGSVEELEKLSGEKIKDLHRENIDHITIPSKDGKGKLRRIADVFDCWFESGSMPYAQNHYPFENKEKFLKSFPADFIAEGLDQTRGWFYTLTVLGTALFGKSPFKNVIVNGLILAEDGKKMSKSLKNYPAPEKVINLYGADALRLYLINSPVVRAESLKFSETGVKEVIKTIFLPWYNAYRLFVQNSKQYAKKHNGKLFNLDDVEKMKFTNVLDRYIISKSQSLVKYVSEEMKGFRLYTVIPKLLDFVDTLTNLYVRLNRPRLKGAEGEEEQRVSLATLFRVLFIAIRTMSPFTPFLCDTMYQNLKVLIPENRREDTIHYWDFPKYDESLVDTNIEESVAVLKDLIEQGRKLREQAKISMKFPVQSYTIVAKSQEFLDNFKIFEGYLLKELNVKKIEHSLDLKKYYSFTAIPDNRALGRRLQKKFGAVRKEIKKLTHEDIVTFMETGSLTVLDEKLTETDLKIQTNFVGDAKTYKSAVVSHGACLLLNYNMTKDLLLEGYIRCLASDVQQLRKNSGLVVEDKVDVFFKFEDVDSDEKEAATKKWDLLTSQLKHMDVKRITKKEELKGELFKEQEYPIKKTEEEPTKYTIFFTNKQ